MGEKHTKALNCLGGFELFQKRARNKISALMTDFVSEYGVFDLKPLSEGIGVPLKILELLYTDPEKVPMSADLVERLACPLNISMTHFLDRPKLSEEDREYFRKCMEDDGFSVGLHPGESNPFDMEALYIFLLAGDAINSCVEGKENAFLN